MRSGVQGISSPVENDGFPRNDFSMNGDETDTIDMEMQCDLLQLYSSDFGHFRRGRSRPVKRTNINHEEECAVSGCRSKSARADSEDEEATVDVTMIGGGGGSTRGPNAPIREVRANLVSQRSLQ